jgi:uncharacterized protein (TIGR00369 family)
MELSKSLLDRMNDNPLYRSLGIRLEEAAEGRARSCLTPKAEVCWPFPDQPHGGILFTLMDTTMAWAVQSLLESGLACTTVDLHIQYLAPAKGGHLFCRAWTTRQTKRLAFVRADILDSGDHPLASGQATFRIMKMDFV